MQKFNLYEKLMAMSICLLFGMMPIMDLACSSRNMATDPAPASQTQEPNVQPDRPTEPTKDSSVIAMEKKAQLYEAMIAKMDKYVTTNNDGTYTMDYQGFQNAERKILSIEEQQVVENLTKGIPIVNAQILQERRSPGSTALGQACWYFWWGFKCCYWGAEGFAVKCTIQATGLTPWPFNLIFYGLGSYAEYIWYTYDHICLTRTWAGTYWITS